LQILTVEEKEILAAAYGGNVTSLEESRFNRSLLFEDLHHELCLNLIQLFQRYLQNRSVSRRGYAEDAFEPKGKCVA
jgi:hypothetical protein